MMAAGLDSGSGKERAESVDKLGWWSLKCNQQQSFCQSYSRIGKNSLGGLVGFIQLTSRYFPHVISARLAFYA